MKRREFIASAACMSMGATSSVDAESSANPAPRRRAAKPASRVEATAIIANARKIVTRNGVEQLEAVRIGGIEQWVSVRGADRRNPVLLHVHGGPGYISIPMSWWLSLAGKIFYGRSMGSARDRQDLSAQ